MRTSLLPPLSLSSIPPLSSDKPIYHNNKDDDTVDGRDVIHICHHALISLISSEMKMIVRRKQESKGKQDSGEKQCVAVTMLHFLVYTVYSLLFKG